MGTRLCAKKKALEEQGENLVTSSQRGVAIRILQIGCQAGIIKPRHLRQRSPRFALVMVFSFTAANRNLSYNYNELQERAGTNRYKSNHLLLTLLRTESSDTFSVNNDLSGIRDLEAYLLKAAYIACRQLLFSSPSYET
jgi:hypothetical protein